MVWNMSLWLVYSIFLGRDRSRTNISTMIPFRRELHLMIDGTFTWEKAGDILPRVRLGIRTSAQGPVLHSNVSLDSGIRNLARN